MLKFLFWILFALMRKDLQEEVRPEHYDLYIDVQTEMFNGTVTMHLNASKAVKSFQFNSKNLELSNLTIKQESNVIESKFTQQNDFVTVSLEKEVSDKFTLFVEFKGVYSPSMEGFYKSKYNQNDLYSTHFEPSDARQAFPCFDQPDMKSTFSITIDAPEGFTALSNASLQEKNGNRHVFEKTPLMSTYIVAYVVGKLDYIEDDSYIPIRVYADPEEKHWGKFSLDVAVRCLKFFESYFEVKYPLKKLDMVAIPSFAMGAMENWGLITYRKTSLLFDEASTSIRSKKNIACTVCHELAHMWFGNLVTMKWWSDLWLNEGFATWAATLAIENSIKDILPWDAWNSFINDEIESGMHMDCIKSTHKIGVEVNDPVEVDQIFDAISYSKGSSVIKMLENWLSPEVFRRGLVHYIKKFSYSNTVTSDLWNSLTFVANQSLKNGDNQIDVAKVIDPWIQRDGFPYITVEDTGDSLKLTQKRFTLGYTKNDEPWSIPIRINWMNEASDDSPAKKIKNDSKSYIMWNDTFEIKKESTVYKINDEVSGFYRVLYPKDVLMRLIGSDLSVSNRMNLYSDAFSLSKGLYTPIDAFLELVNYLDTEDNYEILLTVISDLSYLRSIFYDSSKELEKYTSIINGIVKRRFLEIDLKAYPKDINEASRNSLIVSTSVHMELPDAISKLKSVNIEEINPEYMRSCLMARINDEFEKILEIYKTSTKPGEKQHALFALGSTTVEKNIEFIFDNIEMIEPHDSIYLFASFASNLKFRNKISSLFIDKFEGIRKHIANSGLVRHSIEYLLRSVLEDQYKEMVTKFLDSLKGDREMKSAVDKTLDYIEIATSFKENYFKTRKNE